ncbi:prepilin-type N-terminal cleavage/methylation domain-containing protein [Elusimicrobium posterum]|uniref:type IV pilin protein n=1 Tax=Elusimicrobium posterum TaxID=3116653 RepID=UPI003C74929A
MKKGFTLIELLVVVLIIGILASIALPQYTKAVEKSRTAEALILLKSIVDSSNRYYLEHGTTPTSFESLDLDFPNVTSAKQAKTKAFTYELQTSSTQLWAIATRTNNGSNGTSGSSVPDNQYVRIIYYSSEGGKSGYRYCTDKNSTKTCKGLGAGSCSSLSCSF